MTSYYNYDQNLLHIITLSVPQIRTFPIRLTPYSEEKCLKFLFRFIFFQNVIKTIFRFANNSKILQQL